MKLLYRGIPYESVAPSSESSSSPTSNTQPKIRLTYRGTTYEYQSPEPPAHLVDKAAPSDLRTITLIYRGQTYKRQLPVAPDYQTTRDLNLRWQFQS
jgi:hypothetical protein